MLGRLVMALPVNKKHAQLQMSRAGLFQAFRNKAT